MASYFLAAYNVIEDKLCKFNMDALKVAVEHYEERLSSRGGDTVWLRDHLLRGVQGPALDAPVYRNQLADDYLKVLKEDGLFYFAQCHTPHFGVRDLLCPIKKTSVSGNILHSSLSRSTL